MKNVLTFFALLFTFDAVAQTARGLDTIRPPANLENIYAVPVGSDSLATSVLLFIKKEVKLHRHAFHSEHVVILSGEAEMRLGEKQFTVRKNDVVFIPKGTPHAVKVTSAEPLKCISIQSPHFDGKDRVMME
jgi:mannose-6-phosphate isomerase-like protein (cupin superfamily)